MAKKKRRQRNRTPQTRSTPQVPVSFQGHTLDPFQVDAIIRIQQGASTLVGAPTGTGKSLIADYLVAQALETGARVIYTAPIKALVNQKFRDFARRFDPSRCGIMTGDLAHNPGASVVVMTTEVLRNKLLRGEDAGADWAVFDEIHYINHPERGTVWEEAILLLPRACNILGLSATVPNIAQIAAWMGQVREEPVYTIVHGERAVPLQHLYFTDQGRAVSHAAMWQRLADRLLPGRDEFDLKGGTLTVQEVWSPVRRTVPRGDFHHLDVVAYLRRQRLFPCIYFAFSRRACERMAAELAQRRDFLTLQEREAVRVSVRQVLQRAGVPAHRIPGLEAMQQLWYRGVGVHHAGLLPIVKHIVEHLLERRILRIVYATETFAVGVNMPVRTVCFDGLEKFDGQGYRLLSQQEYLQMAGRAGRRGLDRQGTVISVVDYPGLLKTGVRDWEAAQLEPITSRFRLGYTAILNLLAQHPVEEIPQLFRRSLRYFQAAEEGQAAADQALGQMMDEFHQKLEVLQRLGYWEDGRATPKGEFCRHLWIKELLVAEMAFDGALEPLTPPELAGWAASTVWEPRPRDDGLPAAVPPWAGAAQLARDRIVQLVPPAEKQDWDVELRAAPLLTRWCEGAELEELLGPYPLEAGDFAALCRQTIDLLRQIATAAPNPGLQANAYEALRLVDRDVVAAPLTW